VSKPATESVRELRSETLILEPIVQAHAAKLFDDLQAPELYTFIPHNPPTSIESLRARYERWEQRQSPDGSEIWLNFAVFHRPMNAYVGTVQATCSKTGATHIAYDIFPKYWRRGFARDACTVLVSYLFSEHKLDIISALLDTRNKASWKLLESLGFRQIRILKNADTFKGAASDEFEYELNQLDWKQRDSK